jgi:hypothetical protein
MTENQIVKAKSKSKVIASVVVCVAIVLVAAFVGIYYLVPPKSEQTPTSEVVHNFSDGAYMNYEVVNYYRNGTAGGHGFENETVTAGTYAGTPCWIYGENLVFTYNNGSVFTNSMTTYYDKSTYATLQRSTFSRYANGQEINETLGPNDEGFVDDLPYFRSLNVTATNQHVSVPAGTFECTVHEGPDLGSGATFTSWVNKDVPTWGEVKIQYSTGDYIICTYTLESYGY